jgi:hypothetical protein
MASIVSFGPASDLSPGHVVQHHTGHDLTVQSVSVTRKYTTVTYTSGLVERLPSLHGLFVVHGPCESFPRKG